MPLTLIDDFTGIPLHDTQNQQQQSPVTKPVKQKYQELYVPKDHVNKSVNYTEEDLSAKITDPEKLVEETAKLHPNIAKKDIARSAFTAFLAESYKLADNAKNMDELMFARETYEKWLEGYKTNKFLNSTSKAAQDFYRMHQYDFENKYKKKEREIQSVLYDDKIKAENNLDVTPEDYGKIVQQIYGVDTPQAKNAINAYDKKFQEKLSESSLGVVDITKPIDWFSYDSKQTRQLENIAAKGVKEAYEMGDKGLGIVDAILTNNPNIVKNKKLRTYFQQQYQSNDPETMIKFMDTYIKMMAKNGVNSFRPVLGKQTQDKMNITAALLESNYLKELGFSDEDIKDPKVAITLRNLVEKTYNTAKPDRDTWKDVKEGRNKYGEDYSRVYNTIYALSHRDKSKAKELTDKIFEGNALDLGDNKLNLNGMLVPKELNERVIKSYIEDEVSISLGKKDINLKHYNLEGIPGTNMVKVRVPGGPVITTVELPKTEAQVGELNAEYKSWVDKVLDYTKADEILYAQVVAREQFLIDLFKGAQKLVRHVFDSDGTVEDAEAAKRAQYTTINQHKQIRKLIEKGLATSKTPREFYIRTGIDINKANPEMREKFKHFLNTKKSSDTFTNAFDTVIKFEGTKHSTDPNDRGNYVNGELKGSKFGISAKAHPDVDIKHLTLNKAKEIYKKEYWEPLKLNLVNDPKLQTILFDSAVNQGKNATIKMLREAFHLKNTGKITDDLLMKINSSDPEELSRTILALRQRRYNATKGTTAHKQSWDRRIRHLYKLLGE